MGMKKLCCLLILVLLLHCMGIKTAGAAEGKYVALTGICTELEKSPLRRRIKNVYLQNDQHRVKIASPQGRMKNLRVGDELTVYISDNTPVYEMDGYKVICSILALGKEASA